MEYSERDKLARWVGWWDVVVLIDALNLVFYCTTALWLGGSAVTVLILVGILTFACWCRRVSRQQYQAAVAAEARHAQTHNDASVSPTMKVYVQQPSGYWQEASAELRYTGQLRPHG